VRRNGVDSCDPRQSRCMQRCALALMQMPAVEVEAKIANPNRKIAQAVYRGTSLIRKRPPPRTTIGP